MRCDWHRPARVAPRINRLESSALRAGVRAFCVGAVVAIATTAAAPPSASGEATSFINGYEVVTNPLLANLNTGEFSTPNHVRFFRPGSDVVGDSSKGNYKSGFITISGHVVLHDSGNSPEAQSAGAPTDGGPATLECDQLTIDSKQKIYVATGHVHYTQGTRTATADSARFDRTNHALDLSGNVHLADGTTTMSTPGGVHYDTLTKDVSTNGNTVVTSPAQGGERSTLPTPKPKPAPTHKP